MALTVQKQRAPSYPIKYCAFLFDNSYPAGGYPVLPSDVGLFSNIDLILFGLALNAGGNCLLVYFDPTTSKIRVFYPTGSTIASPAAVGQPIVAAGAVAVTGVAADGRFTAGAGKEVAAATDLSTYTVYGVAIGN